MTANFEYDMAAFLPFRDKEVCRRVRNIKKAYICTHPNPNFQIRIIEDNSAIAFAYVVDIVAGS